MVARFGFKRTAVRLDVELRTEGGVEIAVNGEGFLGVKVPHGTDAIGCGGRRTVGGGCIRFEDDIGESARSKVDGFACDLRTTHPAHHEYALFKNRKHIVGVNVGIAQVGVSVGAVE